LPPSVTPSAYQRKVFGEKYICELLTPCPSSLRAGIGRKPQPICLLAMNLPGGAWDLFTVVSQTYVNGENSTV